MKYHYTLRILYFSLILLHACFRDRHISAFEQVQYRFLKMLRKFDHNYDLTAKL